ncbi:MAG: Bifunctional PGK/TIM [Microgenomates bacterium OLB22]|nr:MAG: Bifunctional PGK/TIM [Microgenomates bacterium OLB22]
MPLTLHTQKYTDDSRIVANVATLKLLLARHNRVICLAKHGKPTSLARSSDSLRPVSRYLQTLLPGEHVEFIETPLDQIVRADLRSRSTLILLENTRYHQEEYDGDIGFAKHIAHLGDWYVNDCFATSHRKEASIIGVPQFLPSSMGLHFKEEIEQADQFLDSTEGPSIGIIGGAKVSKKLLVLPFLLHTCDSVIVGGAVANTLLAARGCEVGSSLVDKVSYPLARKILSLQKKSRGVLLCPLDVMVTTPSGAYCSKSVDDVGRFDRIVDLGPITTSQIEQLVAGAQSVIWAGPLGYVEEQEGQAGTISTAQSLSKKMVLIGGGDTGAFLRDKGLIMPSWHTSTGGGALLEYIEHRTLPGIRALEDSYKKNRHHYR